MIWAEGEIPDPRSVSCPIRTIVRLSSRKNPDPAGLFHWLVIEQFTSMTCLHALFG